MPQQNPASKHHYVPAFYLSRWESPRDTKLTEYSNPYNAKIACKPVKAKSTGYVDGLYSLEGYEPELAQQVEENFFKSIDDRASKSLGMLEKFGHRARWDSESRSSWTRFILSLWFRCPEDIVALRDWTRNEVFGRSGPQPEAKYAGLRAPDDPESFSEYLRCLPTTVKERHMAEALYSLIDNSSIGTDINNMEWRVLEATAVARTFMTSDRPIIHTSKLNGRAAHIALPIGPRLLFIASPDVDFLDSISSTSKMVLVKEVNRHVVEGARRFVYGCDDSQARFVENRFGKNPQRRFVDVILGAVPDHSGDC